jgi:radical SAM superfamily enzyme YgiQ (UPF0313 family)
MKAPGEILLVACYELGHQPLAVAWPAAVLEEAGYQPAVLDLSIQPFDEAAAARARLAAISVPMHTALRIGVSVAERIRKANPSCHVCFYGLYASLNAEYLLAGIADSVVGGEPEAALADLVRALEAGGDTPETSGVITSGARRAPRLSRQALPTPARAGLPPIARYVRLEHEGRTELTGYVEASRGCRHRCRHCPIPPVYDGRFFAVPVEVCLADAAQQVKAGATHITFGDPDFLNGPTHAIRVARAVHEAFPRVTFDFTAKVEHLLRHQALLAELKALGCLFIVSAVESLSGTVLAHLDKGHTREDVGEALRAVRAAGIALRPTWVAFTPWTTLGDYQEMLDFVESEDLVDHVDPVQYTLRLLVPPGSLLLEGPALRPYLGDLCAEEFSYRWAHPDPRMETLQQAATELVTQAAERREDAAITFARVRELADATAGRERRPPVPPPPANRVRPPRLTESWFC